MPTSDYLSVFCVSVYLTTQMRSEAWLHNISARWVWRSSNHFGTKTSMDMILYFCQYIVCLSVCRLGVLISMLSFYALIQWGKLVACFKYLIQNNLHKFCHRCHFYFSNLSLQNPSLSPSVYGTRNSSYITVTLIINWRVNIS